MNAGIWTAAPVRIREEAYADAVAQGAMALFGEKYGDVVRVVEIEGLSVELCGGTHVRNTAEIGLLRVVSEGGVAAGVRRIEAVTGPRAFQLLAERDRALVQIASRLKVPLSGTSNSLDQIERKLDTLFDERKQLEKRLDDAMRGGASGDGAVQHLVAKAVDVNGLRAIVSRVEVADVKSLQALGDALLEKMGVGVGVLATALPDGKGALLVVAADDVRARGLRADLIVRDIAATVGGRGGGKAHMAQAGIDSAQLEAALLSAVVVLSRLQDIG